MFTVAILTVSDKGSQGKREDKSGETIKEIVSKMDARVVDYDIVPDEDGLIPAMLISSSLQEGLVWPHAM
jgi:molybdopterin adenylyltransferase